MISNLKLFQVGNFEFNLHHLLIIAILAISFSISAMIRSQPADYGFALNEFDPFFNYRATEFIVENGVVDYFNWQDYMSWHPKGRDVSATSQVTLHITAATLYQIFGGNSSLYDFTIVFPVVFGSFTAIVVFALVRVIGGTTAGLFASLFFALSAPILIRGMLGWFKSEPLGLFFALLGLYLFLSGIKHDRGKISFIKLVGGGVFLSLGLSAWGGTVFFIIPIGIFLLISPFLRKDHRFLIWAVPVFIASLALLIIAFERPGLTFITGYGGFLLIDPAIFLIVCIIIQKFSKQEHKIRNGLVFLGGILVAGISTLAVGAINLPSFRYLNAVNPFLVTQDALTDSVAEHATTTIEQSFFFFSILMVFAGIGAWLIFRNKDNSKNTITIKNEMTVFALIIGFIGVYVSSAFIRLEVFAAISVIILASIGLSVLTQEIFKNKKHDENKIKKSLIKISYLVVIISLLVIPVALPVDGNWTTILQIPPTILNGGTVFNFASDDWLHAMNWLKNNTPEDSVVASWWDYGYWITTLGERISLADNATLNDWKIAQIAQMLLSDPENAWRILSADSSTDICKYTLEFESGLNDCLPIPLTEETNFGELPGKRQGMDSDYLLIFLAGHRVNDNEPALYVLRGGGDESKKNLVYANCRRTAF